MEALSDDDFERVSDIDLTDCESDPDRGDRETPSSTPPSIRTFRPSDRKNIACPYSNCLKTFNRNARLEEHIRSHTNNRIFKCDRAGCGKDFLRETHLKHHIKSAHTNIRDHKCTWEGCEKSFATGTRLRRHFQAHEGREKYRCRGHKDCNQTFRKHETLKRHVLQVHEQMKPFPCNHTDLHTGRQCDKAFDTTEKLRSHERNKHDNARFSCTECLSLKAVGAASVSALSTQQFDVFFATYADLQAHIVECHPPTCPHCPTSFTTSKELTRHLELQHDVIDPNTPRADIHPCAFPDCGRTFTKKGNLTVHVRTVHERKKDFICGETEIVLPEELRPQGSVEVYGCGRTFTTKASLEDHVRSAHLGIVSLQVARKNKRKAEKREADGCEDDLQPRSRKPRKDKGVKKVSVIESLTGFSVHSREGTYLSLDPALANPGASSQLAASQAASLPMFNVKTESDDDDDDWNQLSGSMTMLGDHLFHNGEQYEYSSNRHSLGHEHSPDHSQQYFDTCLSAGYNKVPGGLITAIDDEPFFDGFEHEPELMSGTKDREYPPLNVNF